MVPVSCQVVADSYACSPLRSAISCPLMTVLPGSLVKVTRNLGFAFTALKFFGSRRSEARCPSPPPRAVFPAPPHGTPVGFTVFVLFLHVPGTFIAPSAWIFGSLGQWLHRACRPALLVVCAGASSLLAAPLRPTTPLRHRPTMRGLVPRFLEGGDQWKDNPLRRSLWL